MRLSCPWGTLFLLVATCGWAGSVHATEYRQVTLADGTTWSGIVTSGDEEHLVLETAAGDVSLPLMDIVQIRSVDRETVLHATKGYVLCLPLDAGGATGEEAERLGRSLCEALRRDLLEPVPLEQLSPEQRERANGCADMACKEEAASEIDAGYLLTGRLTTTLSGLELSTSLHTIGEEGATRVTAGIPDASNAAPVLANCAARLLGEPVATGPEPGSAETGPTIARDEGSASGSPPEGAGTERPGARTGTGGGEDPRIAAARKYDFVPVPGLSSAMTFDNLGGTLAAGGAVVAVTGLTVYLAGDIRVLGASHGLPVPWTYEERGAKDAVLLTSAGVATYLVTTWVANVLVRKIHERRIRRAGSAGATQALGGPCRSATKRSRIRLLRR